MLARMVMTGRARLIGADVRCALKGFRKPVPIRTSPRLTSSAIGRFGPV